VRKFKFIKMSVNGNTRVTDGGNFIRFAHELTSTRCRLTGKKFEYYVMELLEKYNLEYEFQPNGKNSFPDFRVTINGMVRNLECKASRNSKTVTWNSGFPHRDAIYTINCLKYDYPFLLMGKELISTEDYEVMESANKGKIKKVFIRLAKTISDKLSDKWGVYIRVMFQQKFNFDSLYNENKKLLREVVKTVCKKCKLD
jgi:hypothetical protein